MSQADVATPETKTSPEGTQDVPEVETPQEKALHEATPEQRLGEAPLDDAQLKKAVAQAVTDMFKPSAWKPKYVVKFKIQCPSGQTALVKHLDTLDLLEYDLVEELDFFTRKLFPIDIDPSGTPIESQDEAEQTIWKALGDVEKRRRFLDMTGKLMATASVNPRIIHDGVAIIEKRDKETGVVSKHTVFGYQLSVKQQIDIWGQPIPTLPDGAVYSGYIDLSDRMVFFQELNRPLELIQPFREEQAAMLQDMARGQGDGDTAESTVGS